MTAADRRKGIANEQLFTFQKKGYLKKKSGDKGLFPQMHSFVQRFKDLSGTSFTLSKGGKTIIMPFF